jgi:hypothetical protein
MSVFGSVFVAMLASLGVALLLLEIFRTARAKKAVFVCVCFREELLEGEKPDMVVICRNDAELDEFIERVSENDERRMFIKKF